MLNHNSIKTALHPPKIPQPAYTQKTPHNKKASKKSHYKKPFPNQPFKRENCLNSAPSPSLHEG
jgi:hypothetical protein